MNKSEMWGLVCAAFMVLMAISMFIYIDAISIFFCAVGLSISAYYHFKMKPEEEMDHAPVHV